MKWDSESYWLKAVQYSETAHGHKSGSADFGLYCALALEFLARATLAKIHPVLLVDGRDVEHGLLHALGYPSPKQPRSADMTVVVARLSATLPEFGEHSRVCAELVYLRNEELHTGEPAFEGRKEFGWLPRYYGAVQVLCKGLGKDLESLLGSSHATAATAMIGAAEKDLIGTVKRRIQAHRDVFDSKASAERGPLLERSKIISVGERVAWAGRVNVQLEECPACHGMLRKFGVTVNESAPKLVDDALVVEETSVVQRLTCPACGFHLDSPAEVRAADIEPRFTEVLSYDPREVFDSPSDEGEPEYMDM
jgi:hypothetical protein